MSQCVRVLYRLCLVYIFVSIIHSFYNSVCVAPNVLNIDHHFLSRGSESARSLNSTPRPHVNKRDLEGSTFSNFRKLFQNKTFVMPPITKELCFYYCNLHSILGRDKLRDFNTTFADNKSFDVIAGSETWLNSSVADTEILSSAYNIYRHDRPPPRTGGGVLIAVSAALRTRAIEATPIPNCEAVWVEVLLDQGSRLIMGNVYIPPDSDPACIDQLSATLSSISESTKPTDSIIIFGDFNHPGCVWNYDRDNVLVPSLKSLALSNCLLMECIAEHDLHQHIGFPTRGDNYLDLLFTTGAPVCVRTHPSHDVIQSDHTGVEGIITPPLPPLRHVAPLRYTRNWKRVNVDSFKQALRACPWNLMQLTDSVDECCDLFYDLLNATINDNVLNKKNLSSDFPDWYSEATILAYHKKRRAHERWKRSEQQCDYVEFTDKRREFKHSKELDYSEYLKNIEQDLYDNPSKFFKFVNSKMTAKRLPNTMTYNNSTLTESHEIAEKFSEFFKNNMLVEEENVVDPEPIVHDDNPFIEISREEIENELRNLACNKSTGSDPIPTNIIRQCYSELSEPLSILFHFILKYNVYPIAWKTAKITPVHKKGVKNKIQNFRPISLLPIFSKIFEKFIYSFLYQEVKNILPPEQHGFVPQKSTVTNLTEFHHQLSINMNNKLQTDAVYLDYEKAFDRVSHILLVEKLSHLGINPSLLRLITNYLKNRSQIVCIDSIYSKPVTVTSGVPQGSLLGPLLFIAYVSDLPKCLQFSRCLMYADDTKIYTTVSSITDCILLQKDLNSLFLWCQKWKLCLNIDKCEIMSISNKVNTLEFAYNIGGEQLKRVDSVRDLGVIFDSSLSFDLHINKVCKSAATVLGMIRRSCSKDFDACTIKRLYIALVRPILEYASPVWSPHHTTKIDRIERIQRRFLRMYCAKLRLQFSTVHYLDFCHFAALHTLQARRAATDLILLYKILNGCVNSDLVSAVSFHAPRRVTRVMVLFKPPFARIDVMKYSFMHRTQLLFNEIMFKNTSLNLDLFFMSLAVFKRNVLTLLY